MITIDQSALQSDVMKYMETYATTYVDEARKLLTEKGKKAVEQFYSDYNPTFYDRTDDFRKNSVKPYPLSGNTLHHGSTGTLHGGVILTSQFMQDYKSTSAFEVAEFAFHGWHGDPTGYNGHFIPIHTEAPLDIVKKYFNSSAFKNKIKQDAHNKAKAQHYAVLDFR